MPELDFSHTAAWTSPFPIFACKWAAFFFGLAVSVFLLASMQGWGGGGMGRGKGVITSMRMRLASSVSILAPCRCGKRRRYCGLRCFLPRNNASSKFKAVFLKQIALTVMAMVRMMMMMIINHHHDFDGDDAAAAADDDDVDAPDYDVNNGYDDNDVDVVACSCRG